MARPLRLVLPDQPVHVVQRGHNRDPVFRDDRDRCLYRQLLVDGCDRLGCAVHAYVLMTNHVHLLVTPTRAQALSELIQWIGRHYVTAFNRRHRRSGTLWEGRFRSSLVDSPRYFLACSRYIDQNPVRAGMVDAPEAYRWSSHARLGFGVPDALVTEHAEYTALGPTAAAREAAYRTLCQPQLDEALAERIRHAGRRGDPLGSPSFIKLLQRRSPRPVMRLRHGGDRRSVRTMSTRPRANQRLESTTLTP
jgi:putative transposase